MRFDAVLADADDDRIGLFELGIQLAEPASLLGSTRRTVLRIKEQHNSFTLELVQRVVLAIVAGQAECRRPLTLKVFHRCNPSVWSSFHKCAMQKRQTRCMLGENHGFRLTGRAPDRIVIVIDRWHKTLQSRPAEDRNSHWSLVHFAK